MFSVSLQLKVSHCVGIFIWKSNVKILAADQCNGYDQVHFLLLINLSRFNEEIKSLTSILRFVLAADMTAV
jgi:hypothetical protein